MESFITLFLFYTSIVFGFQNAHYLSKFVGDFFGVTDTPHQIFYSAILMGVIFFSLAQVVRRWLVPSGAESGCFPKLVTFVIGIWFVGVLFLKMQVYLGQIAPVGLATGTNVSNPAQLLYTLLKHEEWVDAMINFWFSEKAPYLFYQIIVKSIPS